jgi:hypothetical protein
MNVFVLLATLLLLAVPLWAQDEAQKNPPDTSSA